MANEDKKDFNAMLHDSKDMPKFQIIIDQKSIEKYGGNKMYFAPPIDYDKVMKKVPYGKVITVGKIREHFAKLSGADFTEPITAGIFVSIVAWASYQRSEDETPYWRTLKANGELNAKYYPVYLSGLWGPLWISAVTVFLGALLGMVVALMRMSRLKILRTVFNVYVEILRGTPILLQLYFFWIGLPKLVPFELTDTQCIVAALVVNASAFISEIIRAGIGAVDKGQWEAARSIGLSETHVMTRIILPQAVKNILLALCNEFISTVKGTSLASVFFVGELMTSFKTVQSATFLALQSLTIVGIIYFLLNFILSRLLRVIERRLTVSD